MGCSPSTPALKGAMGLDVGAGSRHINNDCSTFTEGDSHPRTTSSEAKDLVPATHQPDACMNLSASGDAKTVTTASSSPSLCVNTKGLPVAKDDVCHRNFCLGRVEGKPADTSCAQEDNCVHSTLLADDLTHPCRGISVDTSRRRYMSEASLKSIKVNCTRSGQSGALRPRKATQVPPFDSLSAIGSLLIIDAPLSPRRSVALAAVAAACRAEGIPTAKISKVGERKLVGQKRESSAKQTKGREKTGVSEVGQNVPRQQEFDLKEISAPSQKSPNVQPKSSLPDASHATPTRVEENETENAVGECAPSRKRPPILERIKNITPKLTDQMSPSNRLHQLLHLKSKDAVDPLNLPAGDTNPVATAVVSEATQDAAEFDKQRQQKEKGYKPKLSCGLFSFTAPRFAEKKRCVEKEKFLLSEGSDTRKRSCHVSVESAKAALIRLAEAVRHSLLLMNAPRKCAFWSLVAVVGKSRAREATSSQQIKRTENFSCQTAEKLDEEEAGQVQGNDHGTKQTVKCGEHCTEHVQVSTTQTAFVAGGVVDGPSQQVAASAAREISTTALTGAPFGNEGDKTEGDMSAAACLGLGREIETFAFQEHLPEPSEEELRAVWCVMKIGAAKTRQQKAEWLHQLELLVVKLNPLDTHEPTRDALLEARLLDRCVEFLRDFPNCADLCASSLAILVYMSLNEETSEQLAANHGYEAIAALLKKYYNRCVELVTKRAENHICDKDHQQPQEEQFRVRSTTGSEPVSGVELRPTSETTERSPPSDAARRTATNAVRAQNQENADRDAPPGKITHQTEELRTEGAQRALLANTVIQHDLVQCKAQKKSSLAGAPHKEQETQDPNAPTSRDCSSSSGETVAVDLNSEVLLVELLTLIWRIIFASSLDGDEYAQIWVAAGAAEPAIQCLASDLPVFSSSSFVCWVFGALRFLPLDNASLCTDFVQHRRLFECIIKKMELHCTEPMLMENGFAVLANYQRNHPVHTAILCKIPQVWQKCVNWLRKSELFYAPDTVYQGLYAIGLACSYSPTACVGLKEAGGIDLATRLSAAYEIFPLPEFRLDSTPDAGASTPVSSGSFEGEHFVNNDAEEDANAGSTAGGFADTGAHFDNAGAAAVVASVDIKPSPAAAVPVQDGPPLPDASDPNRDCTTEKMKIIFQFAEGLIRLLESCPATAEPARRSLQEEAITEEDEEAPEEEEEEDGVEVIEELAKRLEKREEPPKTLETREKCDNKDVDVVEVLNVLQTEQIRATVQTAHEAASRRAVRASPSNRSLQREDADTYLREREKLVAFSSRVEEPPSYTPPAESCAALTTELRMRQQQEEGEEEHESQSGVATEMSSEGVPKVDACDSRFSRISELKEVTAGNALQKNVYAVSTSRAQKPAGQLDRQERWKASPPVHDQIVGDPSANDHPSKSVKEQGKWKEALCQRESPTGGDGDPEKSTNPADHYARPLVLRCLSLGDTFGKVIDPRLLTSSSEVTPLQEQQTYQEVGGGQRSRLPVDDKEGELLAKRTHRLDLSGQSEEDGCEKEDATNEGGGAALAALQKVSSARVAGPFTSVQQAESQETAIKLPESGSTWGPGQTQSRALPETPREEGTEDERPGPTEEGEDRSNRGRGVETGNEEDLYFHSEETLLLLPSCGEGEYTKCPTYEVDDCGREEDTDKEVEDDTPPEAEEEEEEEEEEHEEGEEEEEQRDEQQLHEENGSADEHTLSQISPHIEGSSARRTGKKRLLSLSTHFSPPCFDICSSCPGNSASANTVSDASRRGAVFSRETNPLYSSA